jgi:hypothetical protein
MEQVRGDLAAVLRGNGENDLLLILWPQQLASRLDDGIHRPDE